MSYTEEEYIILKFGRIKGGNFANNPEASKLFSSGDDDRDDIAVIKAFNGKFFLWWEQTYTDKQGAIDYIKNYIHAT